MSSPFSIESAQEKAIESQLVLKRLPIAEDAVNIVKSFIFRNVRSYVKKVLVKPLTMCWRLNNEIASRYRNINIGTDPFCRQSTSSITYSCIRRGTCKAVWICNDCGKFALILSGNIVENLPANRHLYCCDGRH